MILGLIIFLLIDSKEEDFSCTTSITTNGITYFFAGSNVILLIFFRLYIKWKFQSEKKPDKNYLNKKFKKNQDLIEFLTELYFTKNEKKDSL